MTNGIIKKRKLPIFLVLYPIIYLSVFLILCFDKQNKFSNLTWYGIFCVTSCVYLSLYIGLKLGVSRLTQKSRIRCFIEKIHVSYKEIIMHILIIMVAIVMLSLFDTNSDSKEIKILSRDIIMRIEDEYKRTDVNSVIEVEGYYIITFSDDSKKFLKIK